jgi:hypothetical protein
MNYKAITSIVKRIIKKESQTSLGRWGVSCQEAKKLVADRSNVDHCGPCGYDESKNPEDKYEYIIKSIEYYKNKERAKLKEIS